MQIVTGALLKSVAEEREKEYYRRLMIRGRDRNHGGGGEQIDGVRASRVSGLWSMKIVDVEMDGSYRDIKRGGIKKDIMDIIYSN